jgi:hypothetical protein
MLKQSITAVRELAGEAIYFIQDKKQRKRNKKEPGQDIAPDSQSPLKIVPPARDQVFNTNTGA